MLTLLAVGEDFDLLKTRAEVLRRTGANVVCCDAASALKLIDEWEFDLVVLCHSVGQLGALHITESAHLRSSKTLVLRLIANETLAQAFNEKIYDAVSDVEPSRLLQMSADLLTRPPRPKGQTSARTQKKKPANYPADIAARQMLIEHRRTG
jgi:DNA-binding NtrC family response regulator